MLSPLFFSNPFLSLNFSLLLCAVFQDATAFKRDLSKWQVGKVTTMYMSTYTLPLLLSLAALILFLNNALSSYFSNPFYPWKLFFVLLLWCSVLRCYCLQWWSLRLAGRESDDHASKYVHSYPPLHLQDRSFFRLLLFPLLLSVAALILFLNNALSSFFFPTHFYPWTFLCCAVSCSVFRSWCLQ